MKISRTEDGVTVFGELHTTNPASIYSKAYRGRDGRIDKYSFDVATDTAVVAIDLTTQEADALIEHLSQHKRR